MFKNNEERYLTLNPDGTVQTPKQEAADLMRLGADGLIGDFPETINLVRDRLKQNDSEIKTSFSAS